MKLLIDGDPIVYRIAFASQKRKGEDGLVIPDPESHALHSCKVYLNDMIEHTECESYKIFLTGKDNLESRFHAQVVNGIEADDALALEQLPDHSTAIATIDKDLLMVEGLHYNYNTREWKVVTHEEGTRFFYKQMLTGDRVDNITGIRGIGDKKADKLLDAHDDWDALIIEKYMEEFEHGYHRAVENTQLLWMLQRNKQMPMEFK